MNTNKKASSQFRIDDKVFLTMAVVCLCALIIMAFRFVSYEPCGVVKIQVNNSSLLVGSTIIFKAEAQKGEEFVWNFGDGTTKKEESASSSHVYKDAGHYTVVLTVNGSCSDIQSIVVDEPPIRVATVQPMIISNDIAYLNEPYRVKDGSNTTTKWEWRFGETTSVDAYTKEAMYKYTIPGKKTITLTVDGKHELTTSKSIYVTERKSPIKYEKNNNPPPPQIFYIERDPEPKKEEAVTADVKKVKNPPVTYEQIRDMLSEVMDGKKTAADFRPYLCGKNIPVLYNGKLIPFNEMCEDLKKNRVKKIKSLKVHVDADNCLHSITLEVKKKSGLF